MTVKWLLERLEKGVRASASGCASMAVRLRSQVDGLDVTASGKASLGTALGMKASLVDAMRCSESRDTFRLPSSEQKRVPS
jgi:hypothetical protein